MDGIHLAFSWLTILPFRGPRLVDRHAGAWAIAASPLIGLGFGVVAALMLWGMLAANLPWQLAGVLTVGALALFTRGMHIDGLADTADGLGTFGSPARAQEVMRAGGSGPFGVATLVVVLVGQALALGALAEKQMFVGIVVAIAAARVSVVLACRTGIRPARKDGFGALVVGTQSWALIGTWIVACLFIATMAVSNSPIHGPVVVVVAFAVAFVFTIHCARRFAGLNGDVLGAVLEITVLLIAVGMLLGN
ncbi:adenosylcobinamide-GDP ribazoletransferase [Hoyosella rhizosphaerae]|uniref:adenosylcobinamide-GDP ribazoletransferase n=1 Tax=Hoyosella rhizosphaerae TaxID=1755582 RepID=UPI001665057F|nr:adenosylcobinamide-GDP ribazoletransferase [Hoyosella rhizosphaerae]MBN4927968.1 adenosylcobinamide-GDP ribazoletransferase [Hoyosella rhizosphaerae]